MPTSRMPTSRVPTSRCQPRGCQPRGCLPARANLADANLAGANLADAKNAEFAIAQTRILHDGDLIGWKKCMQGVIVKLRIPEAAKRSHAFGRKCRAEYADVIGGHRR